MTLAVVWITIGQVTLRDPVIGHNQQISLAVFLPMLPDTCSQRFDVSGFVIIVRYKAQFRHPAAAGKIGCHSIKSRRSGGCTILRIKRQYYQLSHALTEHSVDGRRHGRLSVTHGKIDHHIVTVFFPALLCQCCMLSLSDCH